jgi:hypothetical protein
MSACDAGALRDCIAIREAELGEAAAEGANPELNPELMKRAEPAALEACRLNVAECSRFLRLLRAGTTQWVDTSLTSNAKAVPAAPGSALDGYWEASDNSQHVNYSDANGHLHELIFRAGAQHWVDNDLTAFAAAIPVGAGSQLNAYAGSDGSQHIDYFDASGNLQELHIP